MSAQATLLSTIHGPADLRLLSVEQLAQLAEEIRQLIKTTVSRNGGHLASNLGVVELTLALHYVFDFARDRLCWDVGHQCYVHKLLTGRADRFATLRQEGGLSGFPSPAESPYDPFFVGHAGTAIATALGLALGGQIRGADERIVAVVGDASLVNGLSFEGLNNTSLLHRQFLIILNDNNMAIDATQGAFANYLTHLRLSRSYEDLRRRTKLLVRRLPYVGAGIEQTLGRLKEGLKTTLLHRQIFEQLGIPYFGPVDGHDLGALIELLKGFKDIDHPVLLHVHTEKGRGFAPAQQDPCAFHSTQPFKVEGETARLTAGGDSFTDAFARALAAQMHADPRIVALTAAMPDGTGLAQVRQRFPGRVIDVGICESAAVAVAAGLARQGLRPVVAIYATFLQRGFDQVFQEVSLQNLPVVFCLDRAGLVGGDGAVHHGFCDVALLRVLPHLVLLAPMDEPELHEALRFALACDRPCVLRYPRDRAERLGAEPVEPFRLGQARCLRPGADAAILAYGSTAGDALAAARQLAGERLEVAVYSARFAKPLDRDLLAALLAEDSPRPVLTVEDHALAGGFGSAVLEAVHQMGLDARRLHCLGLPDRFLPHATRRRQLADAGIDGPAIAAAVRELLHRPPMAREDSTHEQDQQNQDRPGGKPGQTPDASTGRRAAHLAPQPS